MSARNWSIIDDWSFVLFPNDLVDPANTKRSKHHTTTYRKICSWDFTNMCNHPASQVAALCLILITLRVEKRWRGRG